MTYIVQRKDRFYVVAYEGLDPLTGRERRRWHPVGHDRADAEAIALRLAKDRFGAPAPKGGPITLGEFMTGTASAEAAARAGHDRVPVLVVRRLLREPCHR